MIRSQNLTSTDTLLVLLSISLCIILFTFLSLYTTFPSQALHPTTIKQHPHSEAPLSPSITPHPIARLLASSSSTFNITLSTVSASLPAAASAYRARRHRHPPPGFDVWYKFATSHNAFIVEQFFDQIYEDLEPFRGLTPPEVRRRARGLTQAAKIVLQGKGKVIVEGEGMSETLSLWKDIFESLMKDEGIWVPEVTIRIPVNENDTPGVIVPYEERGGLLGGRYMPSMADVTENFTDSTTEAEATFDPEWLGSHLPPPSEGYLGPRPYRPYWSLIRTGCPPHSTARRVDIMADIWHAEGHTLPEHSVANLLPDEFPSGSENDGGYMANWTTATDICNMPYLQGLHGAFVAPESIKTTTKLVPIFGGGGKTVVNGDVLLPGVEEWNATSASEMKHQVTTPWERRDNVIYWRGPATGGKGKEHNWRRLHRQRFASMLNSTHVAFAEPSLSLPSEGKMRGVGPAGNFRLSSGNGYGLERQNDGRLARWVETWTDVKFTDLRFDGLTEQDRTEYETFFSVEEGGEQGNGWRESKYSVVLDGDGSDDKGELLSQLRSGSAVLRASIYRDWKDKRLWPWVHYIPMDNTFADVYGIMEYFLSHDEEAQRIAESGKEWAAKVLRRQDMLVYVYRLILEFARILDDSRERLGWVGDLLEKNGK